MAIEGDDLKFGVKAGYYGGTGLAASSIYTGIDKKYINGRKAAISKKLKGSKAKEAIKKFTKKHAKKSGFGRFGAMALGVYGAKKLKDFVSTKTQRQQFPRY